MSLTTRILGCAAALLAAGLIIAPARAQDLTLDTGSGYAWKVKDVQADTGTDPAKVDFTEATTANGWSDADVPGDLNAAGLVGENTNFWYRLEGVEVPSDWPKDHYLILTDFNVDDGDVTYFNGTAIGSHSGAGDVRTYIVPPDLVNWTGDNVIAILGNNVTGAAGMTNAAPTLSTAPSDSGALLIKATNPSKGGVPAPNVLVTTKDDTGTDVDQLTGTDGTILLAGLAPGAFPVEVNSYPWIGSITPTGVQNVTIEAGKVAMLNLTVDPFVYPVVKATTPITIDGDISGPEWAGALAMSVDQMRQLQAGGGASAWTGPEDLSGTAMWKWDENYIYLAADVTDDTRVNEIVADPSAWGNLWNGDGFETYIQLDPYARTRTSYQIDRNYQWTIGVDADNNIGWKVFRATSTPNDVLPPDIPSPDGNAVAKTTQTGYILEARFPWSGLPDVNKTLIPPKDGAQAAIALAINDVDTPGSSARESQISWNTKGDMWSNPSSFTAAIFQGVSVPPAAKKGDMNDDGAINVQDATLSLRLAVGLLTPTDDQKAAGDVNGDGKWNIQDTTLILQVAVGLKTGF